jgi:hypothetical protein
LETTCANACWLRLIFQGKYMEAFYIHNDTENRRASRFFFLSKPEAIKYLDQFRWPFETDQTFVSSSGKKLPLEILKLSVRRQSLPGIYDPNLHAVFWFKDNQLVYSTVVPGYCFVPEEWLAVEEYDFKLPEEATALREVTEKLKALADTENKNQDC